VIPLRDSVVVVTGASSGLGRAVAVELARRGAWLVLGARRADALDDTARACLAAGGRAIAVVTDVTREAEVARLATAALDEWGRIDVWINNAGVTLYASLEHGPLEEHRRVIDTNLWGPVLGARAAIPVFRRQHRGVLINVGSVLSQIGHPFVPSYAISKFGLQGLSEALRVELADEPDIHVCTVLPYAIDTQHFEVAANHIRRAPRAMPPTQSPEEVARVIADLAERPRRTRHVPRAVVLGLAFHAVMPRTAERLLLDALRRWHLSEQAEPVTTGNLFAPIAGATAATHGDRPPMLRTPTLLAWVAARLVALQAGAIARIARRTAARLTSRRPSLTAHEPAPRGA
jgi:NAD(P)-dependent dehydrogenase (short-subunit alcohol dehydrogenase family)